MNQQKNALPMPKDGLAGLKENFVSDLTAGFVVFLLALPLSLGIAKASDFPPVMGLVSAIIGGLLATFFTGSKLTIKGPAAGLIVIVAGAVSEFGGGTTGWQLTLGVMVVAGLMQIAFGLIKLGRFVDFFPLSAVHGMLAAIGLIIIAKQFPVMLNVSPELMKGKGPLELFASMPEFLANMDPKVAVIGSVSLAIMLGWSLIKHRVLRQIPAPLLVLLFAIPAGLYYNLADSPSYTLLRVGNMATQIDYQADFSGISMMGTFIKYVIMIALVGSLESLLTVKAIDQLDPWKRKSDPDKDIIAVGISNTFAAFIGGIPMISEVARSSANVAQGARTRWANFFHGVFLLGFALLAYPLLEMIPNAALAAMLITVGIKLAHPKEFLHTYQIGPEQLAVFVTTIFFTLFEDLLVGISVGILLKIIIHLFRGASFKSLFRANIQMDDDGGKVTLTMGEAALFTNYLGLKKTLDDIPEGREVEILLTKTRLIDHSVMENLHHFQESYARSGGHVALVGLEDMRAISSHPLAARVMKSQNARVAMNSAPTRYGHFEEEKVLHQLAHYLPAQLALKDFVHHNSLHAFQEEEFFTGTFKASRLFGMQTTLSLNEYRKLHASKRISTEIIDRVIVTQKGHKQRGLWTSRMLKKAYDSPSGHRVGSLRQKWKEKLRFNLDDSVQPILFRIVGSYLDQGVGLRPFPFGDRELIEALRLIEQQSYSSFFRTSRAKQLLMSPDLSLSKLLKILVGPEAFYKNYLFDQQFTHKGWSGMAAAVEGTPETLLYRKKITLRDFIILELLLEIDALDAELGSSWQPLAENLNEQPERYFSSINLTEREEVLALWQQAFELGFYDEVLAGLNHIAQAPPQKSPGVPSFQAMFCIDDREESLRRYLEEEDPKCQTFGAPGYFGAAIYFQPYGGKFLDKNCPTPMTPRHLIKEVASNSARLQERFQKRQSHGFRQGLLASFTIGLGAGVRLMFDQFRPTARHDMADALMHMDGEGELLIECQNPEVREQGLQLGFTVSEMTDIVESLLKNINLTTGFSSMVYVVGHGSSSANNPHLHAYNCGACNGRPGAVNARVFAFMANHPEVRKRLAVRNIHIPGQTLFIGGMHDTAADVVKWYDEKTHSAHQMATHHRNSTIFERALDQTARERSRRFASIEIDEELDTIRKAVKDRTVSYFEPRPEYNHASNALCYVGSRSTIKGLFLDRRAFLQSYDYREDPTGAILAKVMAPLPTVCGGINLEYYFSRMDVEQMGAGSKLPHNIVGLFGVANSSDGDLRTGLSQQMIEIHDPIRMMMMIEQTPEIVMRVIKATPSLFDWFDKGWIHLVVLSPQDGKTYWLRNGNFELYTPLNTATVTNNLREAIASAPDIASVDILEATRQNLPVFVHSTTLS